MDGRVRVDHNYPGNRDSYEISGPSYNDALMRAASANVTPGGYCLLGNNCQHWADKVRSEYKRLSHFFTTEQKISQCPFR